MTSLFISLILTWPLITMAFSMAFGAGSLIWFLVCSLRRILDSTYSNKVHYLQNYLPICV